jgi:hypothetical protein
MPREACSRTGQGRAVRAVFRYVNWTVAPDMEPDAEPITYSAQCAVCEEQSDVADNDLSPSDWVRIHAARNQDHHSYREILTRPLRAWRTDGGQ